MASSMAKRKIICDARMKWKDEINGLTLQILFIQYGSWCAYAFRRGESWPCSWLSRNFEIGRRSD